jgi:hypothetical protein
MPALLAGGVDAGLAVAISAEMAGGRRFVGGQAEAYAAD